MPGQQGALSLYAEHLTGRKKSTSLRDAFYTSKKWRARYYEVIFTTLTSITVDWPELKEQLSNLDWLQSLGTKLQNRFPSLLISELQALLRTSMDDYPHQGTRPRIAWFIEHIETYERSEYAEEKQRLKDNIHKLNKGITRE